MPGMSTATVIEVPLRLEPVTDDPFIADLERSTRDINGLLAVFSERPAAPRRRVEP